MDQTGSNINYPRYAQNDHRNARDVTEGDPRPCASGGLSTGQRRGPWNSSDGSQFRQCPPLYSRGTACSPYSPRFSSSRPVMNISPHFNPAIRAMVPNGNINFKLDTDFRPGQKHQSAPTLPSPSSLYCSPQSSSCDPNRYQQYQPTLMHPQLQPSMTLTEAEIVSRIVASFKDFNQTVQPQEIPKTSLTLTQPLLNSNDPQAYHKEFVGKVCPEMSSSVKDTPDFPNSVPVYNIHQDIRNGHPGLAPLVRSPQPQKLPKLVTPFVMIGKRRGGKILPTGVIKRPKNGDPKHEIKVEDKKASSKSNIKSKAWNQYLAEVEQHRNHLCSDEKQSHPLVK